MKFPFKLLFFLAWFPCNLQAQVDTEFWFAPPEVTSGHGDDPIFLRVSTLEEASEVTISIPANPNIPVIRRTIPANSTESFNLSSRKQFLETTPANTVLPTGLRVVATRPITAYYEVAAPLNTDIFVLKGKNGLGNRFVVPSQNNYNNGSGYNPLPFNSFDIVATQNNTVVRITPANNIVGHGRGETFTVKLNRGETFSSTSISQSATFNLGGSVIESNKPIAVTLKEDSLSNGGCFDLIGDQLVPVKVTGKQYVLMKGFLETNERAFVTAIEDNTNVYIGGSSNPAATLDRGEMYPYIVDDDFTFIETDKPSYVLHTTGFGCEIGMAVLPSINCKGSSQISFTRSTSEFFGLNILVRKEGIAAFVLDSRTDLIEADDFEPVPGTNDTWYAAKLNFDTNEIPVGQGSLIFNATNSFQIGIINGDARTSCRFGYFSSFSTLFIGDDFAVCPNEVNILDAGPEKESYLWSTGETTQQIEINTPGTYWVETVKESCLLRDTVKVVLDEAKLELGPNVSICPGDTTMIDAGVNNFSYSWSNGSTERFLRTTEAGIYSVEISNFTGCKASDQIEVFVKDAPSVELGPDTLKCPHVEIPLNAFFPGASYQWNTGEQTSAITAIDSGIYKVDVLFNGCVATDSVKVNWKPVVQAPEIYGSRSVCPQVTDVVYLADTVSNVNYQWGISGGNIIDQSNPLRINVDWGTANNSASLTLRVIDSAGCFPETTVLPVRINPRLTPATPMGPDTVCLNNSEGVVYLTSNTTGSSYNWQIVGGQASDGQGTPQVSVDWNGTGIHGLYVIEDAITIDTVCSGQSDLLPVLVFEDSARLAMDYVTAVHQSELLETMQLGWEVDHEHRLAPPAFWLRFGPYDQNGFSDSVQFAPDARGVVFPDSSLSKQRLKYQLAGADGCGNRLLSGVHENIVLTAEVDTALHEIELTWNAYGGWSDQLEGYEVYALRDDNETPVVIGSIQPGQSLRIATSTKSAFNHVYWVEVSHMGGITSLSNRVFLSFDHPIFIPNVFTPNGDGKNDNFVIENIHLYPENRLVVLNRYGREVLEVNGYDNTWSPQKLPAGVYFYQLSGPDLPTIYKGTVSILY